MSPTIKAVIIISTVIVGIAVILIIVLAALGFFSQISEFIYVNDIHLDPLYEPYSNMNINSSNCRSRVSNSVTPFKFGQYGCDPPNETFQSMLAHWPTITKHPDFILFGGDAIGHGTGFNRSRVQYVIREIINGMKRVYPDVDVLITLGNNDFVPNYGTNANDPLDFESVWYVMNEFMERNQFETFLRGGYYYYDIPKRKLRLLVLNTVIYSTRRGRATSDPYGQFAWIESTSQDAHSKGYKVGIAMHIPAGVSYIGTTQGWPTEYVVRFDDICKRNNILFTLAGHTHYDMLMPLYGVSSTSQGYSLSSPAISPAHSNNPSWRLMKYDSNGIRDVYQYYADIMMNPQDKLTWQLEYQFRKTYSVKDLSVDSLLKVVKWVTETGEGMWAYKERVGARATENGAFYYCILKATTDEQIHNCTAKLAQPRSLASLLPYNDEA